MNKGFTLLELSIVLTIIALILGGIVAAQSMTRSAELTSLLSDVQNYKVSVDTFKEKHQSLPGDMPDITDFYSGVIDGNGDNFIEYRDGDYAEEYFVWSHLSKGGFIEGEYAGIPTSLPESAISGGFFRLSYQTGVYGKDGHMLSLNAFGDASPLAHYAILTPEEAYSIDEKADDGKADDGNLMTFNPSSVPGCITNYYPAGSGDYILSNDDILCKMFFRFQL